MPLLLRDAAHSSAGHQQPALDRGYRRGGHRRRVGRRYRIAVVSCPRPLMTQSGTDAPTSNGEGSWELPMPGTFVIAPDGTVRMAYMDADWTKRLEPAAILWALRQFAR